LMSQGAVMDYFKVGYCMVLAVVAISLAGCGSSGSGGVPVPPMPGKPLDFVSQSVSGASHTTIMLAGTPITPNGVNGTIGMFLDVDKMSLRLDAEASTTIGDEFQTASVSAVLSVSDKRVTAYYNASGNVNCTSMAVSEMPAANVIKFFIKSALEGTPTYKDSASGLNKIQVALDPSMLSKLNISKLPKVEGNVGITVEMDDGSVLRKVAVDGDITAPVSASTKGDYEISESNATAGAPDSSHFEVPKEWGTCYPHPTLSFNSPALKHVEALLNVIVQYITVAPKTRSDSLVV